MVDVLVHVACSADVLEAHTVLRQWAPDAFENIQRLALIASKSPVRCPADTIRHRAPWFRGESRSHSFAAIHDLLVRLRSGGLTCQLQHPFFRFVGNLLTEPTCLQSRPRYRVTVTRKNVAEMDVACSLPLVFWLLNSASNSCCRSAARPLFSAASNAFIVGP